MYIFNVVHTILDIRAEGKAYTAIFSFFIDFHLGKAVFGLTQICYNLISKHYMVFACRMHTFLYTCANCSVRVIENGLRFYIHKQSHSDSDANEKMRHANKKSTPIHFTTSEFRRPCTSSLPFTQTSLAFQNN